jgi:BON domain-containing protein/PRC-barrel domain protein
MLYTRHDLRLASRGWHGGVLEEGVVPGNVLGVALNAAARQVIYTLVPRRRAAKLPGASAHQTGTARTELPTGEVRLTGRARVYLGGRAVGHVSHVWCDRLSGLVTHVLVRAGGGLFARGPERVLPIEAVAKLEEERVTLALSAADYARAPIYRPDADIAHDLHLAIALALHDPRTRRDIKARVEDGHVTLAGTVDAAEQRTGAVRAAEGIAGVRGMTVDIVIQEALADLVEHAVEDEIGHRGYTGAHFRAFTEHGIVYLEGTVPSDNARNGLERSALGVTGVRVVVNNLRVDGEPPDHANGTGPLTRNR